MINESIFVTNTYDKIANEFSNTRYHIWSFVKFFMKDKSESYGIDIGCGNGKNMIYPNMVGVDNCKGFTEICRQKNKEVVLSDVCSLPFQNDTFDYAMSIACLHHLSSNVRREACMNEMIRVIKRGGEGIISVWSKEYQTKRNFVLGDNLVPWKSRLKDVKEELRYYFIMDLEMFKNFVEKFKEKIQVISIENEKGNWILHFTKH